jgi:hypothetical protein
MQMERTNTKALRRHARAGAGIFLAWRRVTLHSIVVAAQSTNKDWLGPQAFLWSLLP